MITELLDKIDSVMYYRTAGCSDTDECGVGSCRYNDGRDDDHKPSNMHAAGKSCDRCTEGL